MFSGRSRLLVLPVLLLLILTLTASCGGEEEGAPAVLTVLLSPSPNANHAGVYLAQQKGYFTEESLTVNIELSTDAEAAMRAVGTGTKDFAIGSLVVMLKLRDEEVPVMAIAAITQLPLHAIVALESAGVAEPHDLNGMRVGYPGTARSEKLLNTMLVSDGLNGVQDLELVRFEVGLTEAMLGGNVDAIFSDDWPHAQAASENRGQSVSILEFKGRALPEHYEHVLVTNEKNFNDREDMTRRFTRAIRRGYEDALANPQSGVDALLIGTTGSVDEDLERAAIELLSPIWEPFRPVRGARVPLIGDQDAEVYQALIRWMRANQLVGSKVHYTKSYHNKFSAIEE